MPSEVFDYESALRDCASGKQAALRRLYVHEADRLMGIALRIVRRRDLAEDVVHEAFMQVWRSAGSFEPSRGSGRVWLSTIVRNRAFKTLRADQRTAEFDEAAFAELPDSADNPAEALARIDDNARLKQCLQDLDEQKRTSILLAYVDGLTQTQIAERLKTPHNTVKAWVRRGLLALRECLQ